MQEYFLNPDSHAFVPSSPPILKGINELICAFRKKCQPVIFTKHINTQENAVQMKWWWKDIITISNPLSCITPFIATEGSSIIIKTQYDAFYNQILK
jgi:isochorismate hydrolase